MDLSPDVFKEWLEKDINYLHSDQVPVEKIFNRFVRIFY